MQSYSQRRGGAAAHLNEILRNQTKLKEEYEEGARQMSQLLYTECEPMVDIDPPAAVRAVVWQYSGWYGDAALAHNALIELDEAMRDIPNTLLNVREVGSQYSLGLAYLARYHALMRGAYHQPEDPENNPYKKIFLSDDTNPGNETSDTQKVLDGITVGQTRLLIPDAIRDQQNRFDYWENALYSSRQHLAARHIAKNALEQYGSALG